MEELLNKLIEKGWKPRNVISKNIYIYKVKDKINLSYSEFLEDEGECMHEDEWYSLRDLVSKGSGLWQFVCENGMIKTSGDIRGWCYHNEYDDYDECDGECDDELKRYYDDDFQYYLIESALCDEDKLEDFILDNVKIEGK